MGHERWFRGQHDGQGRPFDWLAAARQHGIPDKLARALYEQAVRQAHGATQGRVQELYLALLADARRDAARPSAGKVTRTMRLQARHAGKRRRPNISRFTGQPIAPGARTLTWYLEPAERKRYAPEEVRDALAADPASLPAAGAAVPADSPDALARRRDRGEQSRDSETKTAPSSAPRLPAQDISIPGTVAYRQLQANLAAACGYFEELDSLEEEGIAAGLATTVEAAQSGPADSGDGADSAMHGWRLPPALQFPLAGQAPGWLASAGNVRAYEPGPALQLDADATPALAGADAHAVAADGLGGGSQPLPHLDAIQRSFGRHDVRGVRAHVDRSAANAAGCSARAPCIRG